MFLTFNFRTGIQADHLQLPHLPFRLQAEFPPYNQSESCDCGCYHPPRPRLRPLSHHLDTLPLMDIPARYHLRALPVLVYPWPHQCSLQPLDARQVFTMDPFIYSRSRSLRDLESYIRHRCSPHLPEDPHCKSEGCDAPIPLRLNGWYDAGNRATAAATATIATPAGGCKATKSR